MDRLFRSNSSTSSRLSTSSRSPLNGNHIPEIINEEHYSYDEQINQDWNIPNVPHNEIYKKSTWSLSSFNSESHVKTIEQVYTINKYHD